ncbi:peroxiredoxin [Roseococcus sp. SDR]|uniref:peroxiredoxin n=1 Tax=Roseococcus sp. SDR TaxID=2835532 RepID=UPI001BCFA10E|nr:peroxiredoxin [Roseococcus sp. SDR]MBS7791618.1 peroxiredoxin [Roseococcus sp. SDR]MBV1846932.1 peroxiredoxin [Roseococcus sp. SDR]
MPDTPAEPIPLDPPRLGAPAIPFRVRTTMGERSLADYRGRWLLLFSHPADFTPVCTSEFIALARAHPRFQALGCELLGLSVDSLFAHLAWLRAIEAEFGVAIPFPVAEDISMAMARAYGMIHPGDSSTATVRGSFLIDPAGIIRLLAYYPMSTGRSVEELLRSLAALQEHDASGLSTPADWQPGAPALRPPPQTLEEAARSATPAWYHQTQPTTRSRKTVKP